MEAELVVTVRTGNRTLLINAPLDGTASDVAAELKPLIGALPTAQIALATSLADDAVVLQGDDRLLPHAQHPNALYAVSRDSVNGDWTAPAYQPPAAANTAEASDFRLPSELLEYVRGMKPTSIIL
jgi:hypothetical protein